MDLTTTSLCIISAMMGRPRADGKSAAVAEPASPSEATSGRPRESTRNGTGGIGNPLTKRPRKSIMFLVVESSNHQGVRTLCEIRRCCTQT